MNLKNLLIGTSACCAAIATSMGATAAPAHAQAKRGYQIQASSLSKALREYGRSSGVQIIFTEDLVRGKRAPALVGSYSAEEALTRLLSGSGLTAERTPAGAIMIVRNSASTSAVGGQAADIADAATGDDDSEEIIVTGSNIRGGRPTSQVLVLTKRDIDASGSTSVEQLMRKIPQNSQGGVGQETFFSPDASGTDRTETGAGVNLRGLGQRATLVLLNGRRVAPSSSGAFFDISLIPLSAIERVEILTDGASAIYGSDAVGGVVNFILRDDFEGVETQLQAGTATEGGGDELRAGVTAGASWQSGGAMLSYEYRANDEIRAGDRPFVLFPPDTFLFPRERRHSVFGSVAQQLASRLKLDLTGIYSQRDSDRSFFFAGSPLTVAHTAKAEFRGTTAQLGYELGGSWLARLQGGYSLSKNETREAEDSDAVPVGSKAQSRMLDAGLAIDGSLIDLPGGPVKLAVGAAIRSEKVRNIFSSMFGDADRGAKQTVRSAYGEILLPLFAEPNRRPGLERLQLSAAVRYEDYSDLEPSVDPKLGLLWSPLRGLNFRASYGTSFKAPLLLEKTGFYQAIYLPLKFVSVIPTQDDSIVLFMSGSDPDVGPEKSTTWTFGADIEPTLVPGLTVSINYYRIRFSDRIAAPSQTIVVVGDPAFEPILTRNPSLDEVTAAVNGASFVLDITGPGFSNGGATPADVILILDDRTSNTAVTSTKGIDFLVGYQFEVGRNSFRLEANVNHVMDFTDRLTVASPPIRALDAPFRSLDWRGRAGISWRNGGWFASLFANYADDYVDNRTINLRPVDSWTTIDAGLAYEFGDQANARWLSDTRVALNVENLFNNDPPRLVPDPGSATGLGFDPVNATGRARFVTLQLRKRW